MKRKTSGEVTQKKVVRRMGVVDKAKTPQKLGVCFVRGHNRVVMLGKRRLCTKWTTRFIVHVEAVRVEDGGINIAAIDSADVDVAAAEDDHHHHHLRP